MEYGIDYTVCIKFDARNMIGVDLVAIDEDFEGLGKFLSEVYMWDPEGFDCYLSGAAEGKVVSYDCPFNYGIWVENNKTLIVVSPDIDISSFEMDIDDFIDVKDMWLEKRQEAIARYSKIDFIPVEERIEKVKKHVLEKMKDSKHDGDVLSYVYPVLYMTEKGWVEYYLYFYNVYFGYSDGEVDIYLYDLKSDAYILQHTRGAVTCYLRRGSYPLNHAKIENAELNHINNMFNGVLCQKESGGDAVRLINEKYKEYLKEHIFEKEFHKYLEDEILK